MEQLTETAAQIPVSDEVESDDNLVRLWQDELREAKEKIDLYRSDVEMARTFEEYLTLLSPELATAIPKKSALWEDWSVWNFKRHPLRQATALPAEAVRRARNALRHFERLEVWQAVGMADPWLVGVMAAPSEAERYYLLYDWGLETTLDRALAR